MPAKTKLSDCRNLFYSLGEDINRNKNLNCEGKTLFGSFLVQFIRWQPLQSQDKHFKLVTSWHWNKSTAVKISSVHFLGGASTLSRLHINFKPTSRAGGRTLNFLALGKVHNVSIKSWRVISARIFGSFRNHIVAFDESTSMYGVSTLQYVAPLRAFQSEIKYKKKCSLNLRNGFQYVWDASIVLKPKHTSFQVSKAMATTTTIIWNMLQPHCGWSWCTCLLVYILCKWGSLW